MKKFSEEQLKAINTKEQHTAVIAGAGTGKTTVLIARINNLINSGVDSKDILAITFTRKAASEMKKRLNNQDVLVMTFDAFCFNLTNKDYKIIEKTKDFSKKELLAFNIYDANLKKGSKPFKYKEYLNYKNNNNLYDFNDIEYIALDYIKKHKLSFIHILVDEFQDTNNLQFEILSNLISHKTNTFIVGDPDQSIYSFRGANIKLINKYLYKYNAKLLLLTNNYRSTINIIEIANSLISNNKARIKKNLSCISSNCGVVKFSVFKNQIIEYNYIKKLISNYNHKYSIGILFRNHEQGYLYKQLYYNTYRKISVLSIHESKGLEFDIVFLIGINFNVFPSNYNSNKLLLEEERRLFFVGITRAKQELYIFSNKKQSKFIKELKVKRK